MHPRGRVWAASTTSGTPIASSRFGPGHARQRQRPSSIPRLQGRSAARSAELGDEIEVLCPEDHTWYLARVTEADDGGSFVARYDKGGYQYHCSPSWWRGRAKEFKDTQTLRTLDGEPAESDPEAAQMEAEVDPVDGERTKMERPGGGAELEPAAAVPAAARTLTPPSDFRVGQMVTGKVVKLAANGAYALVDVGAESPGMLHKSRMTTMYVESAAQLVEVGDVIDAWVYSKDDGRLALTTVNIWAVMSSIVAGDWFDGTVLRLEKGGAMVQFYHPDAGTVTGLVSLGELRAGFVRSVEEEVELDAQVRVRVKRVDIERLQIFLSMRQRSDSTPFVGVNSDRWLNGTVIGFRDGGILVEVQAPSGDAICAGLVHVSEVRRGFVSKLEDEVELGQQVRVRVLHVNADKGLMDLSMVSPTFKTAFANVARDQWFRGTVASVSPLGVYVNVAPLGRGEEEEGFVARGDFPDDLLSKPASVRINQDVRVRVVKVDYEARLLELSMRPFTNLSEVGGVPADAASDAWLAGTVVDVKDFGALVSVPDPGGGEAVRGWVQNGEIRRGFVEDPREEVEVGQEVRVRVLKLEPDRGHVEFSMRPRSDLAGFAGLSESAWLNGTVNGVTNLGICVILPPRGGAEAYQGHVALKDVAGRLEHIRVGQQVRLRAERVSMEFGRLDLTMRGPRPRKVARRGLSDFADLPEGTWLEAVATEIRPAGIFASVQHPAGGAVEGWLPIRDVDMDLQGPVQVGQTLKVRVIAMEARKNNLVLSMRGSKAAFLDIPEDTWLNATALNVTSGGLFVKVQPPGGGPPHRGLVLKSEMRSEPEIAMGQEVRVRVISVDVAKGRLALSMKTSMRSRCSAFRNVSASEWLQGTVASIQKYGILVAVQPPGGGDDCVGLVALSEIRSGFVQKPDEEANVGQQVAVRVLRVDVENQRLDLSMRPESDLLAFQEVPADTWLNGTVLSMEDFGIFVAAELPGGAKVCTGLVVQSEQPDPLPAPAAAGQRVKVRVLQVDIPHKRLDLSMIPPVNIAVFQEVSGDTWLQGIALKMLSYGMMVKVFAPTGEFATGLVHKTEIPKTIVAALEKDFQSGEEVSVRVADVDVARGRISLSMRSPRMASPSAEE